MKTVELYLNTTSSEGSVIPSSPLGMLLFSDQKAIPPVFALASLYSCLDFA